MGSPRRFQLGQWWQCWWWCGWGWRWQWWCGWQGWQSFSPAWSSFPEPGRLSLFVQHSPEESQDDQDDLSICFRQTFRQTGCCRKLCSPDWSTKKPIWISSAKPTSIWAAKTFLQETHFNLFRLVLARAGAATRWVERFSDWLPASWPPPRLLLVRFGWLSPFSFLTSGHSQLYVYN